MPLLSDWETFLAVQAGAAATLTGLVFVAVSLNLSRILSVAGLPGRAGESIVQFLQIFFVATVGLIPKQQITSFGAEVMALATVTWAVQVSAQFRYSRSRKGHPLSWLITRAVMTQIATVPLLIAGGRLLIGGTDGLYWLVPGFIFSFVAGVMSAWVLLVEILR
jgi:UDP-N-acetylenolpyruvoylglucosamine reductase